MHSSSRALSLTVGSALLLLLLAHAQPIHAQCQFSLPSGGTTYNYDFSSIGYSMVPYVAPDGGFDYYVNICGSLGASPSSHCVDSSASFDQVGKDGQSCFALGEWSQLQTSQVAFIDASNPTGGISLYLQGGLDDREVKLFMLCGSGSATVISVDESPIKTYNFHMMSSGGCGHSGDPIVIPSSSGNDQPAGTGGDEGSGSASAGLSGGWIFIIFVLVGLAVYFLVGALILHVKYGANGKEMVPNVAFWKDLPVLIKDGCVFSYHKVRQWIGKPSTTQPQPGSSAYGTI